MLSYTQEEEKQIKTVFYQYEEQVNKTLEDMRKSEREELINSEIYDENVEAYLEYNNEHYAQNSNYALSEYKEKLETLEEYKRIPSYEEHYILNRNNECLSFQEYKQFISEGNKTFNDIIGWQNMRKQKIINIIYETQRQVLEYKANFERLNLWLEILNIICEEDNYNNIKYGVVEEVVDKLEKYYKGFKNYNEDEIYKFELINCLNFKIIFMADADVRHNYYNEIYNVFDDSGLSELNTIFNDPGIDEFYKHKFIMLEEHTKNLKEIIISEITDRIYTFMYKE